MALPAEKLYAIVNQIKGPDFPTTTLPRAYELVPLASEVRGQFDELNPVARPYGSPKKGASGGDVYVVRPVFPELRFAPEIWDSLPILVLGIDNGFALPLGPEAAEINQIPDA